MIIPPLHGTLEQPGFFIYVAADSKYFDRFGVTLINSVTRNTAYGIHVHLYNPTDAQLEFCRSNTRVSVTWEYIADAQFNSAWDFWSQYNLPEPYQSRKNKMLGMKQFRDNTDLESWLYKTYYACMRFVRLAEIVKTPQRFLEIDIDGLVRGTFADHFTDGCDFHLYQKEKGGHLAGAILYNDTDRALSFIKELAQVIRAEIERDNIYWFLDQHSLDAVIVKYQRGLLPISYVDWHMQPNSAIWSAKGRRKELEVFKREQQKYQ